MQQYEEQWSLARTAASSLGGWSQRVAHCLLIRGASCLLVLLQLKSTSKQDATEEHELVLFSCPSEAPPHPASRPPLRARAPRRAAHRFGKGRRRRPALRDKAGTMHSVQDKGGAVGACVRRAGITAADAAAAPQHCACQGFFYRGRGLLHRARLLRGRRPEAADRRCSQRPRLS
jgi:hypothetical protein